MKSKFASLSLIALLSTVGTTAALAGEAPFGNNPDIAGSILQDIEKPAAMGEREKDTGELYGTSLKDRGGDVRANVSEPKRANADLYGSVLYDVRPDLNF